MTISLCGRDDVQMPNFSGDDQPGHRLPRIDLRPEGIDPGATRNPRRRISGRRSFIRRGALTGVVVLLGASGAWLALRSGDAGTFIPPEYIQGSSAWGLENYGDPDAPSFEARKIVDIDFLGRQMSVHKKAARHFLRLASIFEARAPEYAAAVALGTFDDWSHENRPIRGEATGKSTHAFGLAVDVNALTNVLGTTGDMPIEVVRQWEIEGGDWGGDWSRPDPMHFESHLTPKEIRERYHPDGSPKDWYLRELLGN